MDVWEFKQEEETLSLVPFLCFRYFWVGTEARRSAVTSRRRLLTPVEE